MRFVPIERVEHGMMLAKSIYDYETRTLLREGKLLSDEIIVRIRERGYPGIYIEDELTKDVAPPGDRQLSRNKFLPTFHHRKVAYALPTSCTHPAGRPLFTPQGNKIPRKQ